MPVVRVPDWTRNWWAPTENQPGRAGKWPDGLIMTVVMQLLAVVVQPARPKLVDDEFGACLIELFE